MEQIGRTESEYLRTLAKNVASTVRLRRKHVNHKEDLPIDSIETDPLLR